MSILDHIYIAVSDYGRAKAFYMAALEPLGIELVMERGDTGAFGRGNRPELWIAVRSRSAKGCGINDSATSHAPAESPPIHSSPCGRGGELARPSGRLLPRGDHGGRSGQRPAWSSPRIPLDLLRSIRDRPRRTQPRVRIPRFLSADDLISARSGTSGGHYGTP